jgi:ketol-acid reductoisomerase
VKTSLEPLRGRRIAVLGYGSQGRAQARCLADSGLDVVIGLRDGSSTRSTVERDGLRPAGLGHACRGADLVAFMLPDREQPAVFEAAVRPALTAGTTLLFAHGFNIRFDRIRPPPDVDVVLVGPKAPGPMLRAVFERGGGVPALVAVERDASGEAWDRTCAYAVGIGSHRAGIIRSTFAEETETDLFGEQAVLAGGAGALVKAGFEVLVEAGYQPEAAYFECVHELKLVVDLLAERGYEGLRRSISEVARHGSLTRGEVVIDGQVRLRMRKVLDDIRSGAYVAEWSAEADAGYPRVEAAIREESESLIERTGRAIRAMTPGREET